MTMATFLLTLLFLLLVVAGMSIGLIFGRKPIQGSCGGMSAIGMDTVCDICGGDPNRCDEGSEADAAKIRSDQEQSNLVYDASAKSD